MATVTHRADGDGDDTQEGMELGPLDAWMVEQRETGRGVQRHDLGSRYEMDPILPTYALPSI